MTSRLNVNGIEVTHQREIRDKVTKLRNNPQNLDLCRIINFKF
jgi:hypothetical protein